jgi:iron complex outermembrane receptor protein
LSQPPGDERYLLLNQTSRDGNDVLLWDSRRLSPRRGYTLLASADRQSRRDVNGDGWADLPAFERAVLRPRWFWTGSEGNSWLLTSGLTIENREGGTVAGALLPNGEPFREDLDTRRADMGTVARLRLDPGQILSLRSSITEEWRTHRFGDARERDRRSALFGEAALTVTHASKVIRVGVAAERDAYYALDVSRMSYAFLTTSLFAEHLWSPLPWLSLSSSARVDFHNTYGNYLSPRVSALFRAGRGWTARIAGGTGIFAPTPFTEETEVIGLSRLRPIAGLGIERAQSLSADLGGTLGPVEVNASTFRSTIDHAVALRPVPGDSTTLELVNAAEPTRVGGVEFFARYKREPLSVTGSYAFLQGTEFDVEHAIRRTAPFNPRHSGGLTIVLEEEETGTRAGVEIYYTGRQALVDDPYRSFSRPYAFVDALLERRFGRVSVFLHGEDLNGVRQTRFDPLLRPSPDPEGRWTTDVWAPLEGRMINAGLRWRY